jgi:NhaP-type Na+/H+ or K+/H+ antiporter
MCCVILFSPAQHVVFRVLKHINRTGKRIYAVIICNLVCTENDMQGIVLVTVGGLRGALCLIMVQTVVLDISDEVEVTEHLNAIKSALAMWTAGVVVCTLLINAPMLETTLRITGLTKVSIITLQSRNRARKQFLRFTKNCIEELRKDEDELLQVG